MILLLVHAVATWFMAGVIVFVQIVHYPLFAFADVPGFPLFEEAHSRLTTYVVAFPMLVEAATATLLVARPPRFVPRSWAVGGILLVFVIWLATGFLSVPTHAVLEEGYNREAIDRLVNTNWVRTCGWCLRAVLVAAMIARAQPGTDVYTNSRAASTAAS